MKFKVDDFAEVRKKLGDLGAKPLYKSEEVDIYLEPFSEREVLRIRKRGDDWFLTYKRLVDDSTAQTALEIESRVEPNIKDILEKAGHKVVIEKRKVREAYELGRVTINLDDVYELGKFVEIEYLGDRKLGEEEIKSVAEKFGFNWDSRITSPYIRMLLELKNHKNA